MTDEHQVSSIIATICGASKGNPERTDPEQAKQLAKFIIEALTDAGLQIVPAKRYRQRLIASQPMFR
jgi:hypothetical protein